MRLLSTVSLQLSEFNDEENLPPYAILSHTWGEQEVTFADLCYEDVSNMRGYQKIKQSCARALTDGFEYIWIDTCCIDKSSSSELSEAINSMFRWYACSVRCYAFLEDVTWHLAASVGLPRDSISTSHAQDSLRNSRWFTRGWTLQELISPYEVLFYDRSWTFIGSRSDLANAIANITSIDKNILSYALFQPTRYQELQYALEKRSVAQRMSWAAKRKTTRSEDLAYCLLGLFDIHMPLLYGEGIQKAFKRLQIEILRYSSDQSILTWESDDLPSWATGPLATHPGQFASCSKIATIPSYERVFEITDRFIQIETRLSFTECGRDGIYLGVLACHEQDDFSNLLAIPLKKDGRENLSSRLGKREVYLRQPRMKISKVPLGSVERSWQEISLGWKPGVTTTVWVPDHFVFEYSAVIARTGTLNFTAVPADRWNSTTLTMQFRHETLDKRRGAVAIQLQLHNELVLFGIIFGITFERSAAPYLKLFHGPPQSEHSVDVWLNSLIQTNSVETLIRSEVMTLGSHPTQPKIKVSIRTESRFGKQIYIMDLKHHGGW